jgi:ankyrin repeat protein
MSKDWNNKTALHYAVESENIEIFKILLAAAQEAAKVKDYHDKTPLDYAEERALSDSLNSNTYSTHLDDF